jgi:hypothetical protein
VLWHSSLPCLHGQHSPPPNGSLTHAARCGQRNRIAFQLRGAMSRPVYRTSWGSQVGVESIAPSSTVFVVLTKSSDHPTGCIIDSTCDCPDADRPRIAITGGLVMSAAGCPRGDSGEQHGCRAIRKRSSALRSWLPANLTLTGKQCVWPPVRERLVPHSLRLIQFLDHWSIKGRIHRN